MLTWMAGDTAVFFASVGSGSSVAKLMVTPVVRQARKVDAELTLPVFALAGLADDELDSETGGGFRTPVQNCPLGLRGVLWAKQIFGGIGGGVVVLERERACLW